MCGIAGFIEKRDRIPEASRILHKMTEALRKRGPDADGHWISEYKDWTIALGHRRLSIIDIDGGQQPMLGDQGQTALVFNGEIFNFLELKSKYLSHTSFRTHSDTEVLLKLLSDTHADRLGELNGMFAFGFWDARFGEFSLARDLFGIKPLYYFVTTTGGLAFASELSALLKFPTVKAEIDVEALPGFFFSDYVHAPASLIRGVKKLNPGTKLKFTPGGQPRLEVFSSLPVRDLPHRPSLANAKKEFLDLFTQAIERQLIADVPVGLFLSGGLDSSLIAAFAKQKAPNLHTFSAGFSEASFDEGPFAVQVARQLQTTHSHLEISKEMAIDRVEEILQSLDEPLADHSYVPTFLLSEFAAKETKVVLGGDGGDELFGGYQSYVAHPLAEFYDRIPSKIRNLTIRSWASRLPISQRYQGMLWKMRRFVERHETDPDRRHLRWMAGSDLAVAERVGLQSTPLTFPSRTLISKTLPLANRMMAIDLQTYLPGSLMTKVDRASMRHGLEVRPPFLDLDLVHWAVNLDPRLKIRGFQTKKLLRSIAAEYLPKVIASRPKHGFSIPLKAWMHGPWKRHFARLMMDSPIWSVLNQDQFQKLWNEELALKADHSKTFWSAFVLDQWMQSKGVSHVA